MSTAVSLPRVPHVPAELIPLIDAALHRTRPPGRLSPRKVRAMHRNLITVARELGEGTPAYNLFVLVTALEAARAEVVL